MDSHPASRPANLATWLGLVIAALTLFSAFVIPEVRRKILGLNDPPVEVNVKLQSDSNNRDNPEVIQSRMLQNSQLTGREVSNSEERTTPEQYKQTDRAPDHVTTTISSNTVRNLDTSGTVEQPPIVLETTTSTPPPTDTFAAQLNDILTQADPNAMRRRLGIDERNLLTTGGVVERITQQQIILKVASGQHIAFGYDSSTLVYTDAARLGGDQLQVGDRVYVQWYRRTDGVAALYTIRVTHIF